MTTVATLLRSLHLTQWADLTLTASVEDESVRWLKTTQLLVCHMQWTLSLLATHQSSQALTVLFGDEWDFSVKHTHLAQLQHHSQLTKQTPQQSSLITSWWWRICIRSNARQSWYRQRPDSYRFELRILSETRLTLKRERRFGVALFGCGT